ncbi:hypothetical protein JXM67_11630 [candidate division WOR-3 bacterium]|nr:hypothetical protein [candidate division WOR-3 bacterium]
MDIFKEVIRFVLAGTLIGVVTIGFIALSAFLGTWLFKRGKEHKIPAWSKLLKIKAWFISIFGLVWAVLMMSFSIGIWISNAGITYSYTAKVGVVQPVVPTQEEEMFRGIPVSVLRNPVSMYQSFQRLKQAAATGGEQEAQWLRNFEKTKVLFMEKNMSVKECRAFMDVWNYLETQAETALVK